MQEISEDGVNKMRLMYEHNMKTKGTMTQLRGIHNHIVQERNWEVDRYYNLKKTPYRHFETQTVNLSEGLSSNSLTQE